MTWARIDDGFHSHPKVLETWQAEPAAVGLHARALSYAANHEIDGEVPDSVLQTWIPDERERERMVKALTGSGLWHKNGSGYAIHDFLDYNPSRADLTERRKADRERKRSTQ